VVALRLAQPSLDGRHHVEAHRARLVDGHGRARRQQEDRLALLVLPSRSHDVVHVDLVSHVVDVLDLVTVEGDLGVPQALLLGDVRDVEEQTKSVVIFEAIVYVALCGRNGEEEEF
jgi:hypothetical protein